MHQLIEVQELPITIEEAWDFLSSPHNLSTISPDYMGFKIVSDPPEKIYPGVFIQYEVKPLLSIPMRWVTEITHIDEPNYFVDEQRHGPYSIWHHQHLLEEIDGGVKMTDIVDYKVPMGVLGKLAHPVLVKGKLKEIFNYRRSKLIELFGPMPS